MLMSRTFEGPVTEVASGSEASLTFATVMAALAGVGGASGGGGGERLEHAAASATTQASARRFHMRAC